MGFFLLAWPRSEVIMWAETASEFMYGPDSSSESLQASFTSIFIFLLTLPVVATMNSAQTRVAVMGALVQTGRQVAASILRTVSANPALCNTVLKKLVDSRPRSRPSLLKPEEQQP